MICDTTVDVYNRGIVGFDLLFDSTSVCGQKRRWARTTAILKAQWNVRWLETGRGVLGLRGHENASKESRLLGALARPVFTACVKLDSHYRPVGSRLPSVKTFSNEFWVVTFALCLYPVVHWSPSKTHWRLFWRRLACWTDSANSALVRLADSVFVFDYGTAGIEYRFLDGLASFGFFILQLQTFLFAICTFYENVWIEFFTFEGIKSGQ